MTTPVQQIEYVAIVRDARAATTSREYFRAANYLDAKARFKDARIVGIMPISTVRTGERVTTLNPDNTIGEIGHIVTGRDNDPGIRCFFE